MSGAHCKRSWCVIRIRVMMGSNYYIYFVKHSMLYMSILVSTIIICFMSGQ